MKKALLVLAVGGLVSSAAVADDSVELVETVPHKDKDRRVAIEMIRVTSKKEVVEIKETDADVKDILDELDALEEDIAESDTAEGSS